MVPVGQRFMPIASLRETFGERVISRTGNVNRPPTSYDLVPLNYFLYGYVESLDYTDKPETLKNLDANIKEVHLQMLEKVVKQANVHQK